MSEEQLSIKELRIIAKGKYEVNLHPREASQLPEFATYKKSMLYSHQDGGLYEVLHYDALDTDSRENVIVYKHIWPFETKIYTRKDSEWMSRFILQDHDFLLDCYWRLDQKAAQEEIRRNREERKALESQSGQQEIKPS